MTSKTEQKRLQLTRSQLHRRMLLLNDTVANEAAEAIKRMIGDLAGYAHDKVVINWSDERPMKDDFETMDDGRLLVSVAFVNKVALEVQHCTASSASQTGNQKPYLKLTGGGKKRVPLNGPCIKRFARAWSETKALGAQSGTASQVIKSLERLAEFAAGHEDEVMAMVEEMQEEGIGPEGELLLEE